MVSLEIVESSNDRIRSTLQAGLIAIFVGGTNGVGETTVRQFAKHAVQPRAYIVGRSQAAGDRVAADCRTLNPEGTFIFLKRETSLMRNVDEICNELASKEEVVNLLFLTVGTLQAGISESVYPNWPPLLSLNPRRDRRRAALPSSLDGIRAQPLHLEFTASDPSR